MNEIGRDLGQGSEGEAPPGQPRVRHLQARLADDRLAVEEKVQVDHPGPPSLLSRAPQLPLDAQQEREQFGGTHPALEREDGVDEGGLRHGPHGLGAVKGGRGEEARPRDVLQLLARAPNLADRLAQVGARADEGADPGAQKPAFSILASASLSLSSGTVSARRTKPSPEGPKPLPGVVTTPQF